MKFKNRALTLFSMALICLGAASCSKEKIDKLMTFYVEDEQEFEIKDEYLAPPVGIPKSTWETIALTQALPIPAYEITSNSQAEFSRNGTTADLVKNVTLEQFSLTVVEPENEDFSFLKSMRVFIHTDSVGSDKMELAYIDPVPENIGNHLELIPTKERVDKYLKQDKYYVSTEVRLKELIDSGMKFKTNFRFKVTADPL